jgi:hypothetical protein
MHLLRDNIGELVILIGIGAVSYGAWAIYPPAGFITAGVLLILIGGILAFANRD